jgi:NAD(P)-dependent dehydrogenase (short-subunit alcohol dehydrogenase family)
MDLHDRVALITGGRRIGAAIAIDLARRGMDVALSYNRSRREAEDAAAGIRAAGRRVAIVQANLSQAPDCQRLIDETATALGRLDVLINMASVYSSVPFDQLDETSWDAVVDVDLKASFLCARAAVVHFRAAHGGRIVNFSDWLAASGRPRYTGFVPYYVAKRGIIGLTEALALELAADQILVNAIAPGPILAPPDTTTDEHAAVEKSTPLGRWGGEQEIIKAVAFLLESDFVTGETLRVDGGRHVR